MTTTPVEPSGPAEPSGPSGNPDDVTPRTGIEESDPNADGPEGLAGDMGVSSERVGPVHGDGEEVTYGASPTHPGLHTEPRDLPETGDDLSKLPEQSADGKQEATSETTNKHGFDPKRTRRHGL